MPHQPAEKIGPIGLGIKHDAGCKPGKRDQAGQTKKQRGTGNGGWSHVSAVSAYDLIRDPMAFPREILPVPLLKKHDGRNTIGVSLESEAWRGAHCKSGMGSGIGFDRSATVRLHA